MNFLKNGLNFPKRKTLELLSIALSCLMLFACSNDSRNILVTISNNTDRTVNIYYTSLGENGSSDDSENYSAPADNNDERLRIAAREYAEIKVKANGFDGNFQAVYGGVVETYWVQSFVTGFDSEEINASDFANNVLE